MSPDALRAARVILASTYVICAASCVLCPRPSWFDQDSEARQERERARNEPYRGRIAGVAVAGAPTESQWRAGVDAQFAVYARKLAACDAQMSGAQSGSAVVVVTMDAGGRVTATQFEDSTVGGAAEECIAAVIRSMWFAASGSVRTYEKKIEFPAR